MINLFANLKVSILAYFFIDVSVWSRRFSKILPNKIRGCLILLLCLFMSISSLSQITATNTINKRSINPALDTGVEPENMMHMNYKSLFALHGDALSGGIIANNFGSNGKVTISVYNYDRNQHNGKGALIYQVFSTSSSTDYTERTTTLTVNVVHSIDFVFPITAQSNDIKKLAQEASLYAPDGCKVKDRLTWQESLANWIHFLSDPIQPRCLKYYEPTRSVIVEATITNATLHKFKIPGMGEFDASGFFNYQDKVKSLVNSNSPRFAIIGDEGCAGDPAANVAALVKAWNPDFIVGMGDDNYEDVHAQYGTCGRNIDENCGQYYHDYIYPYHGHYGDGSPNQTNRFWTVLGNHDYRTISGQPANHLVNEWLNFFTYPHNERYYEKVIGDVHLFALNTNVRADGTPEDPDGRSATSTQGQWLKTRLAASTAKYKIVYGHVPPYAQANPDGSHGSDPVIQWPYKEWGASVVLSGDQHYYERNIVDGLNYVINGLGGHLVINKQNTQPIPGVHTEVHYSSNWGAMLAEVGSQEITCTFYDINYHVVDQFDIPATTTGGHPVGRQANPQMAEEIGNDTFINNVIVYPNPTTDRINITLEIQEPQMITIQLFALDGAIHGRKSFQLTNGKNEIDIDQLNITPGLYLLDIEGKTIYEQRRIRIR